MDNSGTIIDLANVRRKTSTSTSNVSLEPRVSSQSAQSGSGGSIPSQQPPLPSPSDPSGGGWHSYLIWGAIGALGVALIGLAVMFHNESKEINARISSNQEALVQKIHETQIDLTKQISGFEQRLNIKLDNDKKDISREIEKQESELNDLQKMLFNSRNGKE